MEGTVTYMISTPKGQIKLVHENYVYHKRKESKNGERMYWRCNKRAVCNSTLVTNKTEVNENIIVYKNPNKHTHEPDLAELRAEKVTAAIREAARQRPNEPPVSIIQEKTENVAPETLAVLPERQALLRNINRHQNKARPPLPQLLSELQILPPYNVTKGGDIFLRYDSGMNDPDRILLFASDQALTYLARSRIILCDGTFKTVPDIFYQLYTMHGEVLQYVYPFVYCLCSRKTKETYKIIISRVKLLCTQLPQPMQLNPQYVMTDMEAAVIEALKEELPDAILKVCLFHFNQAIWRRVVLNGLKAEYHNENDATVRSDIQCLMSLPFVPEEDVNEVFDALVEVLEDEVLPISDYIETTYIKGRPARGRRRAAPPLFPANLWNVHDSVLNDVQRTTNQVEGWHSRLQRMMTTHHASIWKFLDAIRKDQHDAMNQLVQILAGHRRVKHPIPRSYYRHHNQIKTMVSNYRVYKEDEDLITYLRGIGYHLKRHAAVDSEEEED